MRTDALNASQHRTSVTECEQKVTIIIIGIDLLTLTVDDRPGLFGTDCYVNDRGGALDRGVSRGKSEDIDLTRGRPEAVTSHDLVTCGVEQLDGHIRTDLRLTLDGSGNRALGNTGGGYVNKSVGGDCDAVIGSRDQIVLSLVLRLEVSPDNIPCRESDRLRTDESNESTVCIHDDDTLVSGGGYDVHSAVLVNRHCNGTEGSALAQKLALRCVDLLLEDTSLSVKLDQTCVTRITHPNGGIGNKHTLGTRKGTVDPLESKALKRLYVFVVTIQDNDTVVTLISDVNVTLRVGDEIAGLVESLIQLHLLGGQRDLRRIRIGGIQRRTLNGVGVGLICRRSGCADRQERENHQKGQYK